MIESVLSQTYGDWELLLIDDGSKDGTLGVMRSFVEKDRRIRCLDLKTNLGIAAARNIGTFQTSCPFIMHMDADDLLSPTALQEHLEVLKDADVSYGDTEEFSDSPQAPMRTLDTRLPDDPTEAVLRCVVDAVDLGAWWRPPGAVMAKRDAEVRARKRFNIWDRRMPTAGESQYYACLAYDGAQFKPTGTVNLSYRKHAGSDSAHASFFALMLAYSWMLEFWLKELGSHPTLLERKARLMESIRTTSYVEAEFARSQL